eukprot:5829878-Amphidinium_carterae.2
MVFGGASGGPKGRESRKALPKEGQGLSLTTHGSVYSKQHMSSAKKSCPAGQILMISSANHRIRQ